MSASLIAILVLVGLGLVVLFTYIGSVMRFILFDSIVARDAISAKGGPGANARAIVYLCGK